MTPFEIYVLLILDNVKTFFIIITVAMVPISVGVMVAAFSEEIGEEIEVCKKHWKKPPLALIVCLLLATMIPSTKTAIAMYVIPQVMNSEAAQKVPDILNKSLELIDKKLDESLGKKK